MIPPPEIIRGAPKKHAKLGGLLRKAERQTVVLSSNARRRHEKKAKRLREQRGHVEERQQRADEEFSRVLKQVEPLRCASDTVIKENMES